MNQTWEGRAEIEQRIEGLKTGSTIRHEMSTIRIVPIDADHATGVSYATIYSAPAGVNSVSGFALMGEYHDEFVRTTDGWKFSKRVLVSKYSLERKNVNSIATEDSDFKRSARFIDPAHRE